MVIISTRQVLDGSWTDVKVDGDKPLFYEVGPTGSFDYKDVTPISDATTAVQLLVDEAKRNMPVTPMIVVFVHGFKNSVPTAGVTAVAIYDELGKLQLNPAMALLSWCSAGMLTRYKEDRSAAVASASVVSRIFEDFNSNEDIASGAVALNVIAHSMGNYLLDVACESIGLSSPAPARLFHHSISVAADVNRDDFNIGQQGDARCKQSFLMTFYYDGWDGTLEMSEIINHRERFGKQGPHHWDRLNSNTLGVNCADVIRAHTGNPAEGAREVGVGIHSAYFGEPTFFDDLRQVFLGVSVGSMTTRVHPTDAPSNSFRLVRPTA